MIGDHLSARVLFIVGFVKTNLEITE